MTAHEASQSFPPLLYSVYVLTSSYYATNLGTSDALR